jgi:hypothetical protein
MNLLIGQRSREFRKVAMPNFMNGWIANTSAAAAVAATFHSPDKHNAQVMRQQIPGHHKQLNRNDKCVNRQQPVMTKTLTDAGTAVSANQARL